MAKEIIPLDFRKRVDQGLDRLSNDESICAQNKKLIRRFADDCYAEGLSHARVAKYISLMMQVARRSNRPFRRMTQQHIKNLLHDLELSDYTAWTKRDYRIGIKKFWRWMAGTEQYPPIVSWIKTTLKERQRKHPSELLTENEIESILSAAENPRDRALMAVLWETGCRAGELLSLRIGSYQDRGDIGFLDVRGKTGSRRIPVVACIPHLTRWLSFHPVRNDPDSPMWSQFVSNGGPDYLTYTAFGHLVKKLAARASIKKRVHPHLFRHSRATFLAKHLTEAQMKQFLGWTQGSEMASTYVHLSSRDIEDSVLRIYGKAAHKDTLPKITTVSCPRCKCENSTETRFCGRCGSTMTVRETVSLPEKLQMYESLLNALLSDNKVVDVLDDHLERDPSLELRLRQFMKTRRKKGN